MNERWLPIPGYEGVYDVSDLGRVRSWISKRGPIPHVLADHDASDGYRALRLARADKTIRVHQLVLLAFVGPIPDGCETLHGDHDRANNALTNLRYGTPSMNTLDTVRRGTHPQARKTAAPCGHPYDGRNTSGRFCRGCRNARRRELRRLGSNP